MAWILSDRFAVNSMRGGCLSCGNDRPRIRPQGTERIVTSDYDDEFSGVPEFCESCVEEVAKMLGMVPGAKHRQAQERLVLAKAAAKEVEERLSDAQATIRTLTRELQQTQAQVSA